MAIAGSLSFMRGVGAVRDRLRLVAQQFPDRVGRALKIEAEIEMTESKRRCPVDTGRLRASGHVADPERHGRNISVELSYGTDYAVYVHENLEAHHPVGQAKFLESVLNESAPHMLERVAHRVRLDTHE
jgi:hypothetical protein